MSLKIGIIGLPNVGKSTLFQALTRKKVNISAYPFSTIDPNVGVVEVPDQRLEKIAQIIKPKQIRPAVIEFVDIAGLVKGAHQGEGLGNQFLSQIRNVDAVVHVLRNFKNPNISHVHSKIDPKNDAEIVNLELLMADLEQIEKILNKLKKQVKSGEKKILKKIEILEKAKKLINQGKKINLLNEEEKEIIKEYQFLSLKPLFYILNIDEKEIGKEIKINLKEPIIAICLKLEEEISALEEEEKEIYLNEYKLEKTGLTKIIEQAYRLLNLITFFTAENSILQAWPIKKGSNLSQAGEKIHSDFKNFIKAEVINWQDLIKATSLEKARQQGLIRLQGREYILKDGEIIKFKI